MSRDVKAGNGESTAHLHGEYSIALRDESSTALHQIGHVAGCVGVSLRTVRYYEEQGLLIPETRTGGGFRLYSNDQIERLELIQQMKPLGFSVDEMRTLLKARDALSDPGSPGTDREAATERVREFAEVASRRCEELSAQVERASDLAGRLRREARGADARSGHTLTSP